MRFDRPYESVVLNYFVLTLVQRLRRATPLPRAILPLPRAILLRHRAIRRPHRDIRRKDVRVLCFCYETKILTLKQQTVREIPCFLPALL